MPISTNNLREDTIELRMHYLGRALRHDLHEPIRKGFEAMLEALESEDYENSGED